MSSTLFKANKLLLIEKTRQSYMAASSLPVEYHKLTIPHAGLYFREDDECEILSQHIDAGPFSMWFHDIFAKADILLLPYTPFHIWTLHFMIEDSLHIECDKNAIFQLEERECNLFNLYPGLHRIPMRDNTKILSVHINMRPEFLPWLAKKYPPLRELFTRSVPAQTCALNKQPHHMNAVCNFLIQQILSCRYTGKKAHTFIYRCILDLLCNYAIQEMYAHEPFLFSSLQHQDGYRQLFSFLQEHAHRRHSVVELAAMFNLPATELEKGFLQHFSISLQDFSHMSRMMMAYHLLHDMNWPPSVAAEAARFSNTAEMVTQVEAHYECKIKHRN
jgi:AraC-like DNA-binding protein